uniref:atherin-like n=1 Tax=Nyctereutes procyonoides TaxID=34880 RepID=UPI002444BF71|nr:atherin-like [Nyctereutes procyonoides]
MGPGRGCGEAGQPLTPARGCAARARPRRLRAAPDRTPPDPRLGCAAFRPGRAAPPTLCRRSRPPASLLPCPQRHRSAPGTQAAAAGPAAPNMAATTAGPRLFPSAAAGNNRSGEEREGGAPPPPGRRLRVNSGNTRRSSLAAVSGNTRSGSACGEPATPPSRPAADRGRRPFPATPETRRARSCSLEEYPELDSSFLSVSFRVFSNLEQEAWITCARYYSTK